MSRRTDVRRRGLGFLETQVVPDLGGLEVGVAAWLEEAVLGGADGVGVGVAVGVVL